MQYRIIKNSYNKYRVEVNIPDNSTNQPHWKPCEYAEGIDTDMRWFDSIVDAKQFAESVHYKHYLNKEKVVYEFKL